MGKSVQLEDEEWQRILSILSQAPWNIANPLLMKIGDQLRRQQLNGMQSAEARKGDGDASVR